jgi:hypothetical protein
MIKLRRFLFTIAAALTFLGMTAALPATAQAVYTQTDLDNAQMALDSIQYELTEAENNLNQVIYMVGPTPGADAGELWWIFDRQKQQCNAFGYGHSNSCYLDASASYESDKSYWESERDWWSGRVATLQYDRSYAQANLTNIANHCCIP